MNGNPIERSGLLNALCLELSAVVDERALNAAVQRFFCGLFSVTEVRVVQSDWPGEGQEFSGVALSVAGQLVGHLTLPEAYQDDELVPVAAAVVALALAAVTGKKMADVVGDPDVNRADSMGLFPDIVGESFAMQVVFDLIQKVAATTTTVFVTGETGTGKELIARAIHKSSERNKQPLITLNCGALPAELVESELFGHERGSFTGAVERRIGKFERADGGTLFLDEIGELPMAAQVKLLRVLQQKEIERVGGRERIAVDFRLIVATNRNLQAEVRAGRFRADLYYRLFIFPIDLPPLRQRKSDIPALAERFVGLFALKAGKRIDGISADAVRKLVDHDWPGNVRELEYAIERSVLAEKGPKLRRIYFERSTVGMESDRAVKYLQSIEDREREHIRAVLKHCNGKVGGSSGAARILGVPATTLFSKMKKLKVDRGVFE